jgi:hypothetical protein
MDKNIFHPAIAMIELIFAIVVIGIVLLSAPQLMQVAARSGYVALQQEGIGEAASRIDMIMGYHWDENDTDERYLDPVLTVTAGDSDLDQTDTGRRAGTPLESDRSFVRADGIMGIPATPIGKEESGADREDDIDDFSSAHPGWLQNKVNKTTNETDYIEKGDDISIFISVNYINDSPDSGTYSTPTPTGTIHYTPNFDWSSGHKGTSNIKGIIVKLTDHSGSSELAKTITLHAFSCNIGGYRLEEKDF